MSEPRPLHRLFGLSWIDFFQGSPVGVETELDLSLKQQFVDVVLIRKEPGPVPRRLPDGFEELAAHNLITFKSHQEALDDWALMELVGHYVNYRKQCSPSLDDLLPANDFRLFAVCARFPQNLAGQVALAPLGRGVYEVRVLAQWVRVIVVKELPRAEHNAMLLLFSAREELIQYAREHYRPHSSETSTLLYELFKAYTEDLTMADKLKEFVRQSLDELLTSLPPEERLKGLSPEERLEGLSPEELRKRLSPEERLEGLSADEVARALPPETLEELARRFKANGSSPKQ
jgi:hypothetical protein